MKRLYKVLLTILISITCVNIDTVYADSNILNYDEAGNIVTG